MNLDWPTLETERLILRPWKPEGWPDLEIGWAVDRSRWGRGYATEAARAAANWVHRTLKADRVVHLIQEQNVRSIRVAEKLGAKLDGTRTLFGTIDVLVYRTGLPLAPSASAVAG